VVDVKRKYDAISDMKKAQEELFEEVGDPDAYDFQKD